MSVAQYSLPPFQSGRDNNYRKSTLPRWSKGQLGSAFNGPQAWFQGVGLLRNFRSPSSQIPFGVRLSTAERILLSPFLSIFPFIPCGPFFP
ncbi:UNVERIFIED_CONTAM: hypothetical protein Sradi_3861200 [Sesamum radiatum]|uniref:Uncharacterized protein n=1 Tax=Sesamum radiatum TaxID=300843 RepID=A0AAW2Q219_SESRA